MFTLQVSIYCHLPLQSRKDHYSARTHLFKFIPLPRFLREVWVHRCYHVIHMRAVLSHLVCLLILSLHRIAQTTESKQCDTLSLLPTTPLNEGHSLGNGWYVLFYITVFIMLFIKIKFAIKWMWTSKLVIH